MMRLSYIGGNGSSNSSILRLGGAITAIFSLVMGLLVLFVIPSACTFVGSLQLVILALLFIGGLLVFLFGLFLSHRKVKPK